MVIIKYKMKKLDSDCIRYFSQICDKMIITNEWVLNVLELKFLTSHFLVSSVHNKTIEFMNKCQKMVVLLFGDEPFDDVRNDWHTKECVACINCHIMETNDVIVVIIPNDKIKYNNMVHIYWKYGRVFINNYRTDKIDVDITKLLHHLETHIHFVDYGKFF